MDQIQQAWNKLNPRERLTAWGAIVVGLGWIIGLAGSYSVGGNTVALLGAIVVLVLLFLKYTPNQNITWPAPVPLIVLVISAIAAIMALLALINFLTLLGLAGAFGGFLLAAIIAVIVTAVGAGLMAWGAWREYQLTTPARTSGSPSSAMPPPAPSTWTPPPTSASPPPPPPATPSSGGADTNDLPPS